MILATLYLLLVLLTLAVGKRLLRALLGECLLLIDRAVDTFVALFFFLLIVPAVWVWEKSKRPMWRTLTKEQTRELEAWLRRGC